MENLGKSQLGNYWRIYASNYENMIMKNLGRSPDKFTENWHFICPMSISYQLEYRCFVVHHINKNQCMKSLVDWMNNSVRPSKTVTTISWFLLLFAIMNIISFLVTSAPMNVEFTHLKNVYTPLVSSFNRFYSVMANLIVYCSIFSFFFSCMNIHLGDCIRI